MGHERDIPAWMLPAAFTGLAVTGITAARAADALRLAIPGKPPLFAGLPFFVARDGGLFKRHGVNADIKVMASGAVATKAVMNGELDLALVPTQFAVQLIANTKAPLKAVWGLDRSDWLLASMDPKQMTCAALMGARIGVDARRGARWTQLNTILASGCRLKIDKDVKTIALGATVATAMAAGKVTFGLLHVDEIHAIETGSGRQAHVIATLEAAAPGLHHLILIARAPTIANKRSSLQRLLAALRDACIEIHDQSRAADVATIAKPMQRSRKAATKAIKALSAMSFYPKDGPGLDKARIEAAIKNQLKIGRFTRGRSGIKPGSPIVGYDDVVDLTPWREAQRLK